MSSTLDALFRPESIAVIGASRKRGSIGSEVFYNLIRSGFHGPVFPVNPSASVVHSVRAHRSILDVPERVDLAVVVVPRPFVPAVVDECIEKGVRGMVILSAGFAETGREGREVQDEIVRKLRDAGIRLVGPNCLGLLNTADEIRLNATFAPTWPPAGGVAFSSQSGALGVAILDYAQALGIGISHFVSVGNKADVSGNDLLEYWEQDPATRVILLYLESFGNPQRFMEIARRVSRKKPIAVVKSGRTVSGARAASSHTGALASPDVAVQALLQQTGVIRTDTIEELFDISMLLVNQPIPRGNRVAIVTNAGGPGIMATDACEHRGLELAKFSEDSVSKLREFLPPEASIRNPVDMIASATAESYARALPIVLSDEGVDAVLVLFIPPIFTEAEEVAAGIRKGSAGFDKPVLSCFMGTHGVPKALTSLHEGGLPSYAFPEAAAIALSRAVTYGRWISATPGTVADYDDLDSGRGSRVVRDALPPEGESTWLGSDEVAELLGAYGIPCLSAADAFSADEAVRISEMIGYPVAMKVLAESITHKSDVGGVVLELQNAAEVRGGFATIRSNLEEHGVDLALMRGVTVQQMSGRGVETFVGVTREPLFGPLIAFGIGGTSVELWQDVVFRVAPITDVDARLMLDGIRGVKLLDGFRGSPTADREAIVDVLLRISRLALDISEIQELDINPLIAFEPGRGVVATDVRIRVSR